MGLWGLVWGGMSATLLSPGVELIYQLYKGAKSEDEGPMPTMAAEAAAERFWRKGDRRLAVFAKSGLYGLLFAELGSPAGLYPDVGSRLGVVDNIIMRFSREARGSQLEVFGQMLPGLAPALLLTEVGSLLYHTATGDPRQRTEALGVLARAFPSNFRAAYMREAWNRLQPKQREGPFGVVAELGDFMWKLFETTVSEDKDPDKRRQSAMALVALLLSLGDLQLSQSRSAVVKARRAREPLAHELEAKKAAFNRLMSALSPDDDNDQMTDKLDALLAQSDIADTLDLFLKATHEAAPRSLVLWAGDALGRELGNYPDIRATIEILERHQQISSRRIWNTLLAGLENEPPEEAVAKLLRVLGRLPDEEAARLEKLKQNPELWPSTLIVLKRAELLMRILKVRNDLMGEVKLSFEPKIKQLAEEKFDDLKDKDTQGLILASIAALNRASLLVTSPIDASLLPGSKGATEAGDALGLVELIRILKQYDVVPDKEGSDPRARKIARSDWVKLLRLIEGVVEPFENKENQKRLAELAVESVVAGVHEALGVDDPEDQAKLEQQVISQTWQTLARRPFTEGVIENFDPELVEWLGLLGELSRRQRSSISAELRPRR